MFWILWVACNSFRSYLRNMTRFISLNSSRFKTAVYEFFRLYRISFIVFFNGEFGGWSTNADGQKQLLLQIKIRNRVRTKWNAIIANHFHSSFFVFKRGMQTSKTFSLLYIQDWIRNVCKGIFQKKERDLNSFAVTFQVTVIAFKKKAWSCWIWDSDVWMNGIQLRNHFEQ